MSGTEPWDIRGPDGQNVTERKLFFAMRNLGLNPIPQYKVERMTVDFAFPDQMLVVEINGIHHEEDTYQEQDKRRWYVLKDRGWRTKNFSAKKTYYYPEKVAREIQQILQDEHTSEEVPVVVDSGARSYEPATYHEPHRSYESSTYNAPTFTKTKGFIVILIVFAILFVFFGNLQSSQPVQKSSTPTQTEIAPVEKSIAPTRTEIAPPRNICDQEYLNANGGANRRAIESECSNKCLKMEPVGTMEYQDIDCTPPNTITCNCKSK